MSLGDVSIAGFLASSETRVSVNHMNTYNFNITTGALLNRGAPFCHILQGTPRAPGRLACYGLEDYGDALGDDRGVCEAYNVDGHRVPVIGCRITTPNCSSGFALVQKFIAYNSGYSSPHLRASDEEIRYLAAAVGVSQNTVRQNLIHAYLYVCQ